MLLLFWVLIQVTIDGIPIPDLHISKLQDVEVDHVALTIKGSFGQAINGKSFQQEAIISYIDFQYLGYYDAGRKVCLARRKLPAGPWQIIRFDDYHFTSNDAHNTISIGICPNDGTIHVAFDHHGDSLHYRRSKAGVALDPESTTWEASIFGSITSELEVDKPIRITYPRFWETPDGNLQFCYRKGGSGNGARMLIDYDAEQGVWQHTRQMDASTGKYKDELGVSESRCSYPNGYSYGPDGTLHTTWVWREDSQGANHDLMYAYSEDRGRNWKNSAGIVIREPMHVSTSGIKVVDIPRTMGLMNTHGQAVDAEGRIHVVMWHCSNSSLHAVGSKPGEHRWGPPEARRYHHYWRASSGLWKHRELPGIAGSRPKLFVDRQNNLILIYGSQDQFAQGSDLTFAAATAQTEWTDWQVIHRERGPFVNEMLGDLSRWRHEETLSIMVQTAPEEDHAPTPLRVIDFAFD